jgi:integrase
MSAGLYRRNKGIFAFRFKDKDGQWREKSTGTTDRAEARKFKQKFEDDIANDTLPTEKANWTVEQAASLWVQQHAAHLGSDKVRSNERSLLRQLTRRLGERKLKSITLNDLKTYQANRHQEVGARAINLELRILVNVLKEANLWRPIEAHFKRLRERESEIGQALTRAQLHRLETTAAQNPEWEVAYLAEVLSANTGMRSGEIRRLCLGDINLEIRRLRIRKAKTDAGARLVELNAAALEAVTKLYLRAETLGAKDPGHFLLPADLSRHTKSSDPLRGGRGFDVTRHQASWRSAWRSLRRAAGLAAVRFHDLRHSFITADGRTRRSASRHRVDGGTYEREDGPALHPYQLPSCPPGRGITR